MSNNSNNNNGRVPKLRFPEFTGEWEEKKMREVVTSFSGGTPKSGDARYYGGTIPFIRSGEIHGEKTVLSITEEGLNNSSAKLVKKGDLLIALYGATSGEVAISKIDGAINQAILCIQSKKIDSFFLCNYIERNKDYLTSRYLQGGQGNLSSDIIMTFQVRFPTPAEQQKIAECLTEMDNLISAQAQKVELLKTHKKGLMQQLFPQPGETTPQLRFPGFTGEWEVKKLGELASKVNRRNRNLVVSRVLTNSATEGVIDQSDYFDRDIAVKGNTDNYHIVELNDFVYNPRISSSAPVGPISINKVGKGIMSPLYTIFKFHSGHVHFFEHYFSTNIWHPYLKSIANFGARFDRMNITSEGFFNMPLYVPYLDEQQKIAECLSELDKNIEAESAKLEALKAHKKGLMQQLFPEPIK